MFPTTFFPSWYFPPVYYARDEPPSPDILPSETMSSYRDRDAFCAMSSAVKSHRCVCRGFLWLVRRSRLSDR